MTAEPLRAAPRPDKRRRALDRFADICMMPRIERLVQRGREVETATFTLLMADGQSVDVGTIDTLWSQSQLNKALVVTLGARVPPMKTDAWARLRDSLLDAIEVDEAAGERFADTVLEWVREYTSRMSKDPEGAMVRREPFEDGGHTYLSVNALATAIRRRSSASIRESDLRRALVTLGFERRAMNFGSGATRSQASYYHVSTRLLRGGE